MKWIRPIWLALVGIGLYAASVAWVFLYHRIASQNDPPGWIVDRPTPDSPKLLAIAAGCFVAIALLWAGIDFAHKRIVHKQ